MSTFGIPNVAPALEGQLIGQMADVESLLRSHTRSEYPFVDETAHHLVAAGGKRLRPLLTLLTAQYGDPSRDGIIAAAVACEITHLATHQQRGSRRATRAALQELSLAALQTRRGTSFQQRVNPCPASRHACPIVVQGHRP